MKLTIIDPATGKALGAARLRREIVPGVLGTFARRGTRLGQPVMRADTYYANDTRHTFQRIVDFVDMTGWIVRVEANKREREAIRVPAGRRGIAWSGGETVIRPFAAWITTKS